VDNPAGQPRVAIGDTYLRELCRIPTPWLLARGGKSRLGIGNRSWARRCSNPVRDEKCGRVVECDRVGQLAGGCWSSSLGCIATRLADRVAASKSSGLWARSWDPPSAKMADRHQLTVKKYPSSVTSIGLTITAFHSLIPTDLLTLR